MLIGLDEGSSSARISRYETGMHEPPFELAEKLAAALGVPAAYFYCPDESLARLLLIAHRLDEPARARLSKYAAGLTERAGRRLSR